MGSPRVAGSTSASSAGSTPASRSVTEGLPPPGPRTLPPGSRPASTSSRPRRTVLTSAPVARPTSPPQRLRLPPQPQSSLTLIQVRPDLDVPGGYLRVSQHPSDIPQTTMGLFGQRPVVSARALKGGLHLDRMRNSGSRSASAGTNRRYPT